MTKNIYIITKTNVCEFINSLIKRYEVYAPVESEITKFSRVMSAEQIRFLPNRTDSSLKPLFFPPEEEMYQWMRSEDGYTINDSLKQKKEKVIFGARGCDIRSLQILDRYMLSEFKDPYYHSRRNAIIIGMTCDYPRESCFCTAFGGMIPDEYDLWFTDIGSKYLVDVHSERGKKLLSESLFEIASEADIERAKRKITRIEESIAQRTRINLCETKKCSMNIRKRADDLIWKELAKICLACGKCNFICPTCHCFDVRDFVNMEGTEGRRVRVWDACHLYEYARTSAENFRKERDARVRYRIYDKFVFPVMRYGAYACTGCGRCTDVCPAGINIREVLRRLIS